MKKIIILLATLIILPINTLANEVLQMPTDAEIMQVIKTFNFTPEEQAYLFKETKKELQKKINSINASQISIPIENQSINEMLKNTTLPDENVTEKYLNNSNINPQKEIQNLLNGEIPTYETNNEATKTKKYSKHQPLTKRR